MNVVPKSEWKQRYLGNPGQSLGGQGREGEETAVSSSRWPMGPGDSPGRGTSLFSPLRGGFLGCYLRDLLGANL